MTDRTDNVTETAVLTRRKALRRLGAVAALAFAAPTVTMLSAAHASSGASKSSGSSNSSGPSNSGPSNSGPSNSGPSNSGPSNSGPSNSGPSNSGPSGVDTDTGTDTTTDTTTDMTGAKFTACGTEDLQDAGYVQCLMDKGFQVPG